MESFVVRVSQQTIDLLPGYIALSPEFLSDLRQAYQSDSLRALDEPLSNLALLLGISLSRNELLDWLDIYYKSWRGDSIAEVKVCQRVAS